MRRIVPFFLILSLLCPFFVAPAVLGACGCTGVRKKEPFIPKYIYDTMAQDAAKELRGGLDPAALDKSVTPCEDFYQYANGVWLKKHPIPAAYAHWGVWSYIEIVLQSRLNGILQELARAPNSPGSDAGKLADFYITGMDEKSLEEQGTAPIEQYLLAIDKLNSVRALPAVLAQLHRSGVDAFFGFGQTQDSKNSSQVIADVRPAGIGLPDRDYYFDQDEQTTRIREAYREHVVKMFELLGTAPEQSKADADKVLEIETALAKGTLKNFEARDIDRIFHRMTIESAGEIMPEFSWKEYFAAVNLPEGDLNIQQPDFIKASNSVLARNDLAAIKAYLRWRMLDMAAPFLSSRFEKQDFEFSEKLLNGKKDMLPRWKRVLTVVNGAMGEALGCEYVKRHFSGAEKAKVESMIDNFKATLREEIKRLDWMDEATRKAALRKVQHLVSKVGYPEKWRDYSALRTSRTSYIGNVIAANEFEFNRQLAKIGKPLDRTEWGMPPQTINAYYNPQLNEIVFPAAILQAPLFDISADDAVNYGGIGMVIGHELTHGFDDQGAKFDEYGNVKNWWSPEVLKRFKAKIEQIEKQYSSYATEGGAHLNGKLVAGESAADLGGMTLAYKALLRQVRSAINVKDGEGFTPAQRFFFSFAQSWATSYTPQKEQLMVRTNPHPPARFRVNGTIANMKAFRAAFGCKPGQGGCLAEDACCTLW